MPVNKLPLFPVTVVGSWPRPDAVLRALSGRRAGRLTSQEFDAVADEAVLDCLRRQESVGVDIVSDGEQRRDNFIAFVADKLENVRMLTLAELLDYIEDKSAFEEILGSLDVPAFSMVNPAAVGPIARRRPLAADELEFLQRHTERPIKIALPGPYLLTRSMWVEGLSEATYPTKEDLAADVVRVLRDEVKELCQLGVGFIQFDEPVWTELVFTRRVESRTFMCGALSARRDAEAELQLAVRLLNDVLDGVGGGVRTGLHVCRGNWSTNEEVLLSGSYGPLITYLDQVNVDQLVLEFATPRAGDLQQIVSGRPQPEIGLGVVNPRTAELEEPGAIAERVRSLLGNYEPSQIFLNPDCGFGTFANRPMNDLETATAKLRVMVEAAQILRDEVRADVATDNHPRGL